MNRTLLATCLFLAVVTASASAQIPEPCGTMELLAQALKQDPGIAANMAAIEAHTQQFIAASGNTGADVVRTIPVVVHVVYNTPAQNVPDSQVFSQIQVLNEDFRRTNPDAGSTPALFVPVAADTEIQFCLASRDPSGNPTTGITRTLTNVTTFSGNNNVKYFANGGHDAWPTGSYLNIWVCNLGFPLLGYSQLPGGNATVDGVVVRTACFGRGGTAVAPSDLGRVTTHEVGHWFNLRHVWGDAQPSCGDDFVADTPQSNNPHYGCQTGVVSCGGVNMIQNYMEYSDDACMNLFTQGQKARMQATFATGGGRESLLNSLGCVPLPPLYQVNQPDSSLDIDGVQGTQWTPALVSKCVGAPGTLNLLGSSANLGLPFDMALSVFPLVAVGTGGLTFPDGQVINVRLDTGYFFFSTGTAAWSFPPWPGNLAIPFIAPSTAGTVSLQKVQVSPSTAAGYALSQGVQLDITANSTYPAGPTGDDTSVTVTLGGASCIGSISFYGTAYTELFVSSNGRVLFSGADTDPTPTLAEAVNDNPFAGFWTNLDPAAGGSIAVTSPAASLLRIGFTSVRYAGTTVGNSFAIEFDASSGTVALDGLQGINSNPQTGGAEAGDRQFLGISKGNTGATVGSSATLAQFSPGGSGTPSNPNAMIYQFYDYGSQSGGQTASLSGSALNRIVFTPAGTGYSWSAF